MLRASSNSREAKALSIVTSAGPALELIAADAAPPRLEAAASIEGIISARVVGDSTVAFAAFLDGIQTSRVILRGHDGTPVVHGTVAAVIRQRTDRSLHVW